MSLDNGDSISGVTSSNATTSEIEKALAQISGVRAARVVGAEPGRVSEIHVLAEPGRAPKQLVRDIQSAVLTGFGMSIDYRIVSVVQLDREPSTTVTELPRPRPILRRLSAETASFSTEVRVGVAVGGEELDRTMRGPATAGLRLVAQATVDAIGTTLRADAVEVESAEILNASNRQAALVVLKVMTSRGDHAVCGSALVRRDPIDAVARATLDALNRFIGSA
ncbi:MAG: hypothetical protein ACYDCC_09605 [Actinomycetota bacterium]